MAERNKDKNIVWEIHKETQWHYTFADIVHYNMHTGTIDMMVWDHTQKVNCDQDTYSCNTVTYPVNQQQNLDVCAALFGLAHTWDWRLHVLCRQLGKKAS